MNEESRRFGPSHHYPVVLSAPIQRIMLDAMREFVGTSRVKRTDAEDSALACRLWQRVCSDMTDGEDDRDIVLVIGTASNLTYRDWKRRTRVPGLSHAPSRPRLAYQRTFDMSCPHFVLACDNSRTVFDPCFYQWSNPEVGVTVHFPSVFYQKGTPLRPYDSSEDSADITRDGETPDIRGACFHLYTHACVPEHVIAGDREVAAMTPIADAIVTKFARRIISHFQDMLP